MVTNRVGYVGYPPGLRHELEVAGHCVFADVSRGEYDLDVGPPLANDLCELGATHSRHAHVDEKQADLGSCIQKGQCVLPVVSVEDREAESLEHADGGCAGERVVLDDKHRRLSHGNSTVDRPPAYPKAGALSKIGFFPLPPCQGTSLTGLRDPGLPLASSSSGDLGASTNFSVSRNRRFARS